MCGQKSWPGPKQGAKPGAYRISAIQLVNRQAYAGSTAPNTAGGSFMSSVTLKINGQPRTVELPPDMPLLWALRDKLDLVGTKYSCGIGVCGSCTVLVNGVPMRSCTIPAVSMAGAEITTIEGLDPDGAHPVQVAWNEEDVPQCGYCQAGQVLTAAALLTRIPDPTDEDIDAAMAGVLCRCGTYPRIRKAIKRAARAGGAA
jgi:isoquinoline 1-oxidoreductase alpha subunit